MAKKSKPKLNLKDFLLRKGEMLAMGIAGFCLLVLVGWGASMWGTVDDPSKISSELKSKSENLRRGIEKGEPMEEDKEKIKLPVWLSADQTMKPAKPSAFPIYGPLFDPVAQPSTKRENPLVYTIENYQIDLTRSAMPGYDIIYDGDTELIAVLVNKVDSTLDADAKKKLTDALLALKPKVKRGGVANRIVNTQPKPVPAPPPGQGLPPGQPPPGGRQMLPPGVGAAQFGIPGAAAFDPKAKRDDAKSIKYILLKDADESVAKGNLLASTIIPVRLVTIHAEVPYKKQVEEIKRALRLTTDEEAKEWGPIYDGFEVQRRETRTLPDGTLIVERDWPVPPKDPRSTEGNYDYESQYIDKIDTRSTGAHFDQGYIPYFLKPEMYLSMALPQLAPELNVKYPEIKLPLILENIKKIEASTVKPVTQSELAQKFNKDRERSSIYNGKPVDVTAIGGHPNNFGPKIDMTQVAASPMLKGRSFQNVPKGADFDPNAGVGTPAEIENFLLRFVDCDVKPGRTYEYRIRLRMWNPNHGKVNEVADPEFAKDRNKVLYSKWLQLKTPIDVPAESFLYAYDTKDYREQTAAAYPGRQYSELLERLQVKDNQAVVQIATWMEQVKTDAGNKREPVGAWVVTEIPVGRGEYIGRKQYVKLPLWSSETNAYQLREVTDKVVRRKDQLQPKGWLVDFSTDSVLVDFEGGRVKTSSNFRFDTSGNGSIGSARTIEDDGATEMLILLKDGKLVVRSSQVDEIDEKRREVSSMWSSWLKKVETAKAPGEPGKDGEFAPKK